MAAPERIELLFWDGCPSHPEALALLEDFLEEKGVSTGVELHEVHSQAEADELQFPGSPTIRFDGRDVDPGGAEGPPSLTCRIYWLPDGRVSPVPSRLQLEDALR